MRSLLSLCLLVSLLAPPAWAQAPLPEAPPRPDRLIVHEWGTFTQMAGSDGVVLEGLHHEEERLPDFVYDRSRLPEVYTQRFSKMETPVTYFYAPREVELSVTVRYPSGVLTQWYPGVASYGPAVDPLTPPKLKDGYLRWSRIRLVPRRLRKQAPALPQTGKGDPWNHSREVDADDVHVQLPGGSIQTERFLFYRGLGAHKLPVASQAHGTGKLTFRNTLPEAAIRGLILLEVKDGKGRFARLADLAGGASRQANVGALGEARPLDAVVPELQRAMVKDLVGAGLYGKEAWAMVNTWSSSYFRTPGLRLLYLMPRGLVDRELPLEVTPAHKLARPIETVRVMVARLELLTPEREREISATIKQLGDRRYRVRREAHDRLAAFGRFAEPYLRRTLSGNADLETKTRARTLLDALFPKR